MFKQGGEIQVSDTKTRAKAINEGVQMIADGMNRIGTNDYKYQIEKLVACYELLLGRFAPAHVGDRVALSKTPEITPEKAPGWMGSKHFLVKGAQGTVKDVDVDGKGFFFQVVCSITNHGWTIKPRKCTRLKTNTRMAFAKNGW